MSINTHSLDLELSSSQYASIADGSQTGLDLATDFTIEFWIKLEQLPSTATTHFDIISKDRSDATISHGYYALLRATDDKLVVLFYDSSDNVTNTLMDTAFVAGDVGNWVHIAAVVDISAPTITFYKNGSLSAGTAVSTAATTINNSTAPFYIGARDSVGGVSPNYFFDGLVDEVRVWNDIRTGTEISNNYQKELVGNEAGLVGYWKLNNDYLDETSNNNDLTASGSPVFSASVPFVGTVDSTGNTIFFGTNF